MTSASSELALSTFGKCYTALVDESFRSDSPGLLDPTVLATAFRKCQEAVASDPKYVSAYAAHGLAWVLLVAKGGDPEEAKKALSSLLSHEPPPGEYQPFFWMALYWMAVRFDLSGEKAELVLRAALQRHPRSLVLHAFLGRHLNYIDRYADAEKAWREYLRLSPRSPYVMGKLSYTLTRLNRQSEAVELAKKASLLDPTDREALLALASRYLDSKQPALAVSTLLPLVKPAPNSAQAEARGEILLRLGYAYIELPTPDLPSAEKYLKLARDTATRPAEWKTRARAERDLAEVYRRQGKNEAVRTAMANFKREASTRYVGHQANHDEVLAKLLAEDATSEKDSTIYLRGSEKSRPDLLTVPKEAAAPASPGLCSKAIGICFQIGNPTPMGSSRNIDPRANDAPLGSSFNK